jgi:4'-phosphopantetheinyl transferase
MRFAKRRDEWRLGRWTAKRAVAARMGVAAGPEGLATIEVRPAPSGAPEVLVAHQAANVILSLSHRSGIAICVVAPPLGKIGCDLEMVEPRSDAFVEDYFTKEEQALVAAAPLEERPLIVTVLWSAKESALKALREGLRLSTRSVTVELDAAPPVQGWSPLCVHYIDGSDFHGWWRCADGVVRTVVANPALMLPVGLKVPAYSPGRSHPQRIKDGRLHACHD